jgi:hypothetical protein
MSAPVYRTRIERRCAEGAPSVVAASCRHERRRVFRLWAGPPRAGHPPDVSRTPLRVEAAIGAVHTYAEHQRLVPADLLSSRISQWTARHVPMNTQ